MMMRSHGRAFTLVEMLVAIAVLSLLVLLLSQVVAFTEQAITLNARTLDAAGQARLTFDRLGADLASRPIRTDLPVAFNKISGNDTIQFYSAVDSYSGARHLSAIGYRIQETTSDRLYQLERGATGTDWLSGSNPVALFTPQAFPAAVDGDYEVLAGGIFRLEFCYLLNTGTTGTLSNTSPPSDWSQVTAIVVGIAVLDSKSRLLLTNPEVELQAMSNTLKDPQGTTDPLSTWTANLTTANYAIPTVPSAVVKNIRLYQRIFRVP